MLTVCTLSLQSIAPPLHKKGGPLFCFNVDYSRAVLKTQNASLSLFQALKQLVISDEGPLEKIYLDTWTQELPVVRELLLLTKQDAALQAIEAYAANPWSSNIPAVNCTFRAKLDQEYPSLNDLVSLSRYNSRGIRYKAPAEENIIALAARNLLDGKVPFSGCEYKGSDIRRWAKTINEHPRVLFAKLLEAMQAIAPNESIAFSANHGTPLPEKLPRGFSFKVTMRIGDHSQALNVSPSDFPLTPLPRSSTPPHK